MGYTAKWAIALALTAITFASLASHGTFAASRELEKVRIGYSVGGLIPFPLIVAKENRFFEQAGFDVELINIPPTIAVTALISGDIQYVFCRHDHQRSGARPSGKTGDGLQRSAAVFADVPAGDSLDQGS